MGIGILNPGNVCLLSPESYVLESGIQLKESGIARTMESGIKFHLQEAEIQYLESGIHSTEQNPRLTYMRRDSDN